jgi:hypothetical protein
MHRAIGQATERGASMQPWMLYVLTWGLAFVALAAILSMAM